MLNQNAYPGIKGNQMYNQSVHLIQYKGSTNPLDPLGLEGMKYTILDSSRHSNNAYTNQAVYNQPTQMNMNYGTQMNQNQRHMAQQQAYMKQNIPQQIIYNNNFQPALNRQQVQPQLLQTPKIQQQQINPQLQPKYPNQNLQMQPQGYPSQDPNKKIKIEYNNKNNEHFVNRPIYPIRKSPSYPFIIQSPKNKKKQVENLTKNQKLDNGINNENIKINPNPKISQKQSRGVVTGSKINDKKLLIIQENEKQNEKEKKNDMDIKKSGLTIKSNQMSAKSNKSQINEKKNLDTSLSGHTLENNNQNIIQKSISQSVNSDFDANLSHLPTINSIMKGNSGPLPPLKINKYSK